ncbi:hypothetical protein [Infirmifilum sp. NZ]|uniref:hypothetical protein n=1 Tax=Infirmifilum sp. NZ TaxID=2926850 RepID=UPI00279D7E7B|nr:hypothetical protein [Infirmifilum sp. NZ]UNQ72931.1 hypothetical protein MOV14_07415 [Infirmifilum sp. NZ]
MKTHKTRKYSCRLRPARLEDCLRLLDYGSLRRGLHPASVAVSVTEKALWVLSTEG